MISTAAHLERYLEPLMVATRRAAAGVGLSCRPAPATIIRLRADLRRSADPFDRFLAEHGVLVGPVTVAAIGRRRPRRCHDNAAELVLAEPDTFTLWSGYAVDPTSRAWQDHSWVERAGEMLEVTWAAASAVYFGVAVVDAPGIGHLPSGSGAIPPLRLPPPLGSDRHGLPVVTRLATARWSREDGAAPGSIADAIMTGSTWCECYSSDAVILGGEHRTEAELTDWLGAGRQLDNRLGDIARGGGVAESKV